MTKLFTSTLLLALMAGAAHAQTQPGNTSAAPRSSASSSSAGTVKTKSTIKDSKAREKQLKRGTRMVQREHEHTEERIDAQNKERIKEAHKAAGTQAR